MTKLAVFASGTGSLLQAMINAGVNIDLVIVDRDCLAWDVAAVARIPVVYVDRRVWGYCKDAGEDWDRAGFTDKIAHVLNNCEITLVAMAGFMTILGPKIFSDFAGDILNSHPALLPKFPGATAVQDTLEAGAKETGTTIHLATPTLDDATYIVRQQGGVAVHPNDTVDSLWERIKDVERVLYVEVLQLILSGAVNLKQLRHDTDAARSGT